MRDEENKIPDRFRIANEWERFALIPMLIAAAGIVIAVLTRQIWLLIAFPFVGMPSAWLFNIRCYRCAWPAYRVYGEPANWQGTDPMFARLAKPLRLPPKCTKCEAPFCNGAKIVPSGAAP